MLPAVVRCLIKSASVPRLMFTRFAGAGLKPWIKNKGYGQTFKLLVRFVRLLRINVFPDEVIVAIIYCSLIIQHIPESK